MKVNQISLYSFQNDWIYESFDGNNLILKQDQGVVAAKSYAEAVQKITKRFPFASNIKINELEDTDFLFLSKENYNTLTTAEYGLDTEEGYNYE